MNLREVRNEAPVTSFLFSKASGMLVPLSGTFELSPVCNFSCRMCYVRKTAAEVKASARPQMTMAQWLRIAQEAREQGMLYLLLTGGEPFLWPDFWPLYEQLCRMGFLISINTNGSLIDEAAIERLKKNPPVRVNITLYGASDETYEALCRAKGVFAKVDRAIAGLKQAGVQVKLNCSLTPHNAHDLAAMVRYAKERGLILETNTYMFPPVRRDPDSVGQNDRFTPQEAVRCNLERYRLQYGEDVYLKFLKDVQKGAVPPPGLDESCIDPLDGKVRCRAGKASFWITWDGWMTPCGMMPEPKLDLAERPFAEAWRELTQCSARLVLSGTCVQCPNQSLCHSCAAMAMAETGTTEGMPVYLCRMVEALREEADRRLKDDQDVCGE